MKRRSLLLLCILLVMVLLLACDLGNGGDGTSTPVPPAAREGMSALNALSAEGVKADCTKYPQFMACDPRLAPVPVKELP